MEFLESLRASHASLSGDLLEVSELRSRNLWHELTMKLLALSEKPEIRDALLPLFQNVVSPIASKLKPLSVARLGVTCSETIDDPAAAQSFVSELATALKAEPQAFTLLRCQEALFILKQNHKEQAEDVLDECKAFLLRHEAQDVEAVVHATYFSCQAKFHKATQQYDEFYKTALLYLAYADLSRLSVEVQQGWAFDIGVAALLGEKVYNFGELLGNPVIKSLDEGDRAWVHNLLRACNKGDLQTYEQLTKQYSSQLASVPELSRSAAFLKRKVQLMALLNYLFNLNVQSTVIPFASIAEKTATNLDQVEFLLLKALALGIIKGIIDQVAQTVSVTWVQARVLDREEIRALCGKLSTWKDHIRQTLDSVSATTAYLQAQQ